MCVTGNELQNFPVSNEWITDGFQEAAPGRLVPSTKIAPRPVRGTVSPVDC